MQVPGSADPLLLSKGLNTEQTQTGSVEYAECGVRSVENAECGKCGV